MAKADAAAVWCKHATAHANANGGLPAVPGAVPAQAGKPWRYLLIPHDQIQDQMTLAGLAARFEMQKPD